MRRIFMTHGNYAMPSKVQHDFGKAAAGYDAHALLQRQVALALFTTAQPYIMASNTILDAGCGTGYFHELMRSRQYYQHITQLDLAAPMCEVAASYASSAPYGTTTTITGDCESMPFMDGVFDGVFSSLVVQWTDFVLSAKEFSRVLSPQGWLAMSTVGTGTLHELAGAFKVVDNAPHIYPFMQHEDVTNILRQAEFSDITLERETIVRYYPTVMALMRELKALGARYKHPVRKSLLGKGAMAALERAYKEQYGTAEGLPASWNIYRVIAKK